MEEAAALPPGDVIVGIDAGTSVLKAVAFTADGREIAVAGRPNAYEKLPGGGVEQDLERTWREVAGALRDLGAKVPDLARRIRVLAVTAQGDGTCLIDAAGTPVGGGLLWLDRRAAGIAAAVAAGPDHAAIYATTGTGVAACQQPSQLAWLKRHQPARLARAAHAFHPKDFLYLRLTGVVATDPSEALLGFGSFRRRAYALEILDAFDLADEARLLPPILDGAAEAHPLTATAAAATGLPAGLPVVLAPIDIACTGLGGGIISPTGPVGCSVIGSTGCHITLAATPDEVRLNPDETGYTIVLPGADWQIQLQSNFAATLNIDWLIAILKGALAGEGIERSREELLAGLEARVARARPAATLYHPYISEGGERGPFTDAAARASFTALDDSVGFDEMLRAAYEGLAFAARDCYGAIGGAPAMVHLAGGAVRSPTLRAIFAAALDRPVRGLSRAEAGAAGAAMTAAVQQGHYASIPASAADWVTPFLKDPEPQDPGLAALYDRQFQLYLATRQAMRPVWHMAASLNP